MLVAKARLVKLAIRLCHRRRVEEMPVRCLCRWCDEPAFRRPLVRRLPRRCLARPVPPCRPRGPLTRRHSHRRPRRRARWGTFEQILFLFDVFRLFFNVRYGFRC